jgi:vitamin B12 transporter
MNLRTSAVLCAACVALSAAAAGAQAVPAPSSPTPSPSPIPEIGRVQTADRHDEPLRDAVKTTFVVTKDEMIRRDYVTVADALASVPGVNVQRNGPLGTLADLTIDGYRTNQILILIDGRPAAGAQIEFTDVGALPTTGITRIEVVEGGGSTLYGNGALGGVINIITDGSAALSLQKNPYADLEADSLGGRAFTFENGTLSFERRVEPNNYSYPAIGPVPAGTTLNNDDEMTVGRLTTGRTFGTFRIVLDAGLSENHVGAPGDAAYPPLSTTARENTTIGDARLSLSDQLARSLLSLDLSGTTLTSLYTFSMNDPAYIAYNLFGGTTQVSREGRLQASLRDVMQNSVASTLVMGVDLAHGVGRIDDGITPEVLGFAETAVYVQDSLTSAGGDRLDLGLRGERDGGAGGIVAPSVGVRIPLFDALALRANLSSGFHAPDIVDLAYPIYSNPNLKPERSHGGDLALDAPALLGGASLRWFVENGNDLIAVNNDYNYGLPTSPANQYLINIARYSIAGFVGTVRTVPFHGFTSSLAITDTYRALDLTGPESRLPRRPVMQGDLTLEYGHPQGLLDAFGVLAHSVGAHDTPDTQFTRFDAYVRLRAAPKAIVSLHVFDLGNKRYADVSGYPLSGRTFALELSTR